MEAERFHRRLVNACIRAHAQAGPLRPEQLRVAIIGAGATGVELAAELRNATRTLVSYGLDRIDPDKDIRHQPDRGGGAHPAGAAGALVRRRDGTARQAGHHGAHLGARGRSAGQRCAARVRRSRAGGTRGVGGRREGAGHSQGSGRPRDQPDQPARRAADARDHARRERLRHRRLRRVPVARQGWRAGPAARAGRAPAGLAHGEADRPPARRQAARAVALPRLRVAGVARPFLDRRQPDGRARRGRTCGSRAGLRG